VLIVNNTVGPIPCGWPYFVEDVDINGVAGRIPTRGIPTVLIVGIAYTVGLIPCGWSYFVEDVDINGVAGWIPTRGIPTNMGNM